MKKVEFNGNYRSHGENHNQYMHAIYDLANSLFLTRHHINE